MYTNTHSESTCIQDPPCHPLTSTPAVVDCTSIQHYHFDFEVFGGLGGGSSPDSQFPVSDRDPSPFYNHTAPELAEAFVALARLRAGFYRLGAPWQSVPAGTGVILVPFGDGE